MILKHPEDYWNAVKPTAALGSLRTASFQLSALQHFSAFLFRAEANLLSLLFLHSYSILSLSFIIIL